MQPIDLSIIEHTPGIETYLKRAFDEFSLELDHPSINLKTLSWASVWNELLHVAFHKQGADISEVGTTWLTSLIPMDALRPFTSPEVARLGGAAAFLPAAWQSSQILGQSSVWGIPWIADTRVIFYRRDLFEQAQVKTTNAFRNAEDMSETFERLRAGGMATPWAVPTITSQDTLYHILSWVWGAGGELLSPDGKAPLFHQEPARGGIQAYFDLYRFMPRGAGLINEVIDLLLNGQIAATILGPWGLREIRRRCANTPELLARIGLALPPGPSFVGGTSFVIWKHIQYAKQFAVIELIRHLLSPQILAAYCEAAGYVPTRLEVLSQPPFSSDPLYQTFAQALQQGRSHPPFLRWGIFEDRLAAALNDISIELYTQPEQKAASVIARHLELVARRLEILLRG